MATIMWHCKVEPKLISPTCLFCVFLSTRTPVRVGMGPVPIPLEFRPTLKQWGTKFRVEFDRVLPTPPHPPQQCVASSAVIYGAAPAVRGHLLRCMVTARERVLDVLLATHDATDRSNGG